MLTVIDLFTLRDPDIKQLLVHDGVKEFNPKQVSYFEGIHRAICGCSFPLEMLFHIQQEEQYVVSVLSFCTLFFE